jgi:hypothetical protein
VVFGIIFWRWGIQGALRMTQCDAGCVCRPTRRLQQHDGLSGNAAKTAIQPQKQSTSDRHAAKREMQQEHERRTPWTGR